MEHNIRWRIFSTIFSQNKSMKYFVREFWGKFLNFFTRFGVHMSLKKFLIFLNISSIFINISSKSKKYFLQFLQDLESTWAYWLAQYRRSDWASSDLEYIQPSCEKKFSFSKERKVTYCAKVWNILVQKKTTTKLFVKRYHLNIKCSSQWIFL